MPRMSHSLPLFVLGSLLCAQAPQWRLHPGSNPTQIAGSVLTYDSARDRVVRYGGAQGYSLGGGLLDLVRLGGREREHHTRRRFLEDLEQRVPRFARQHVRFVDDVDLVAVLTRRCVHGAFAEFPGIIDAAIGRRVDLDDVE